MPEDRHDIRRIDLAELLPWTILFRGFRIARDPKKIVLGAVGALVMSLGWYVIASASSAKMPTPPDPPAAEATETQRKDYQRQLDAYKEEALRYQYVTEARRFPWQLSGDEPRGVYVPALDRKHGWTNFGIEVPSSFFLVVEPVRTLVLPARLTFLSRGSTAIGLLLLIWTLAVWSLFGAAICRISAVQVARNGNVGLMESIRFALARYVSFFTSPLLPFLGVVLIVLFCVIGSLILYVPYLEIAAGVIWILPLLAGFVIVAALLGLALGWPLMYAAIGAEATESFDALSRAFSYVLGRPWHYLFYALLATVYGGIIMIFATIFAYGMVHMSQYAVSWGGVDTTSLYAFAPEAPGWREAFGPASAPEGTVTALPTGSRYFTALLVGFWTHLIFFGLIGVSFSFFWSEATIIYFLLRRDVDETEIEEVYLEEEDEEPFPTATPTVAPPKGTTPSGPLPPPAGTGGVSLPIVEPPK